MLTTATFPWQAEILGLIILYYYSTIFKNNILSKNIFLYYQILLYIFIIAYNLS